MPARSPEELSRLFVQAINAGDLEALVAMYEPEASLNPQPGTAVSGREAIRASLSSFLEMKPTLTTQTRTVSQGGDIALTSGQWRLQGTGMDGEPVDMTGQSAEVCRRQPDGTWLYSVYCPFGLE